MKKLIAMMVVPVLGLMIAAGCIRQMASVIRTREINRPRLTPHEAVEIYAKAFDKWYLSMPFADRGTQFFFVDFDDDGILEMIRQDCGGTGHYTSSEIYRIMPDNLVRNFIIERERDFSCFFDWGTAKLLRRKDGELLWLLKSLITSNAAGAQCFYTTGVVRRIGDGFYGDEFAARIEDYGQNPEGDFSYLIRGNNTKDWGEVDEQTYRKFLDDFLSRYEIVDVKVSEIEIAEGEKRAGEMVRNALLKAYCGFGYKGYSHEEFLCNFIGVAK